ncbi:MAG: hypothetical protein NZT92_20450, partial [Abditibacteriales bacterium]|nr:hypothetical protein [Abditibacteriales bacterium]MDW8368094.1 hypothetical protein [Abditibacteriales bacterium]
QARAEHATTRRRPVKPTLNNWRVALQARTDAAQSVDNFFGVTDRFPGGLQVKKAPPVQSGRPFVDVAFVAEGKNEAAQRLAWDLRPPSTVGSASNATAWEFIVTTNQPGAEVTLTWDGMGTLPRSLRAYLVDIETGKRQFMRTTTAFTFRVARDAVAESITDRIAARRFRIEVSQSAEGKLQLIALQATAAGSERGRVVRFAYLLNRLATVQARVMSPTGKLLFVQPPRPAEKGINTLLWDGKAQNGAPVPRGIYLFEVIARDGEGETVRAVRAITLR